MCTQINSGVRDINELLACATYQGMTDAEIDSIIEYKSKHILSEAIAQAQMDAIAQRLADQKERNRIACEQSRQLLEYYMGRDRSIPTVPAVQPKTV